MKRIAAVSAVIAVLTACEAAPEKPKLVDGQLINMAGFGFKTDTQSGITTKDGSFQYREGETVTFTLGNHVIGQAEGASELSLFDLFDGLYELPRDAKSLRQQLRSYQPTRVEQFPNKPTGTTYSGGSPSGIHWAANVSRLLLAIDDDKDLSNGVDANLNDWNTKLSGYELDFNMPLDEFANYYSNPVLQRISHDLSLPKNFRLAEPLEQLYASENLVISGNVRTASATNNLTVRYTWTDEGLIEQKVLDYGSNDTTYNYTYNTDGTVKSRTYTRDTGKDGAFEDRRQDTYTYNSYGERLSSASIRFTNNDNSEPTSEYRYQYTYVDDKVYDASTRYSRDLDADGTLETYTGDNYVYDDDFNITHRISPSFDIDGTVTLAIDTQYVYTYDDQGRLSSSERESEFDEFGVPATKSYGRDYSYVGNTVSLTTRTRTFSYYDFDYSYDANGALREFIQYSHSDGAGPRASSRGLDDPLLQSITTATMVYDAQGYFDVCEQLTRDTDGNVTYYNYYDHEWGENGIVASEYRYGNDPEALTVEESIALYYGNEGEWSHATLWGTDEFNYSYAKLDNALAHIVLEVLEIEEDDFDTVFDACGS